jgi:anti-anti-sigma regulatory factor
MDGSAMAMMGATLTIDDKWVVQGLEEAREKLDITDSELVVDFSSVARLDPRAVTALKNFADVADDKNVKVVLRGINVDIYRVLKLVKLAQRFSFSS